MAHTVVTGAKGTACQFFLNDFRILFVVVAILRTKTQEEPRMSLAAAQTAVADEGRRSSFAVQVDPNTLGDVLDKARKILKRSQVIGFFISFFLTIERKSVSTENGVDGE